MTSLESLRTYGLWGVRGLLILLFAASGIGKLLDGQSAALLVERVFEGSPTIAAWSEAVVVLVSGGELVLAGALAWGQRLEETLWVALGVIGGFTAVLATLLGRTSPASCGCFGAFGLGLSVEATILRNLVLLALTLGGILLVDS